MMLNCLFLLKAFPCISTGNFGYPQEKAAEVAISTVRKFIENHPEQVPYYFCQTNALGQR